MDDYTSDIDSDISDNEENTDTDIEDKSISEKSDEEEISEFSEEEIVEINSSVKNTITELLEIRGFIIEVDLHIDEGIKQIIGYNLDTDKRLYILFATEQNTKLNVQLINRYISYIVEKDIKHCIIVHLSKTVNVNIKNIVQNFQILKNSIIEFFHHDDLRFNITKHVLVPIHEKVVDTPEYSEYSNIKKKYAKYLPILLSTDPVARFHGFRKGDIVKIYRKDKTIIYRIVI